MPLILRSQTSASKQGFSPRKPYVFLFFPYYIAECHILRKQTGSLALTCIIVIFLFDYRNVPVIILESKGEAK